MNRSQYLPYTAYTITPYPPQFSAPGYHNVPAMAPAQTMASGTPVSYPPPTYNNFPSMQQSQQQQPQQQPHQNLSAWSYGGGYAPMVGQIEDIVSPSQNNMPTPPGHNTVNAVPGQMGSMMHPASLPQVQDVFAPRQPSSSPFATPMPNQMTQMVNGTSRMVGAYPPMPPGSQGSSPTIAVPQRPVDPSATLARPRMGGGFPPQQISMQGGGVGFGGSDPTMGMAVQRGHLGYSQFNMSP